VSREVLNFVVARSRLDRRHFEDWRDVRVVLDRRGDRITESSGEWEVVGRPYTTNGGKNAHVRVQRASQPGVTETKMWGAYEKVSVRRV
jgi:hypothetical protein